MRINSISISNLYSIKEVNLKFDRNLAVFAGKNESGKTNFIKCLRLFQPSEEEERTHAHRIRGIEEGIFTDFKISVELELNGMQEQDRLYKAFLSRFSKEALGSAELDEVVRIIDIPIKVVATKELSKPAEYSLTIWDDLEDIQFETLFENIILSPNDPEFIHLENIPKDTQNNKAFLKLSKLIALLRYDIIKIAKDFLENAVYWNYSDTALNTTKFNIPELIKNPSKYPLIQAIFKIAGYENLSEVLSKSSEHIPLKNLLKTTSAQATSFIQRRWKDYTSARIELSIEDGNHFHLTIEEGINFQLSQRSDGFRRFFSFLIMVSASLNHSSENESRLLIIDEPENSLHPSAQKDLFSDLKELSQNHFIIISTHSIFMIDSDDKRGHFIVKKENGLTKIKEVAESDVTDEEVVFNALGYSIFSHLPKKVIVVEGWRDKALLSCIQKEKFGEGVGITFCKGVKMLKPLIAMLELGQREAIIVSDSDRPALDARKEFQKEGYKTKWVTYSELTDDKSIITAEDFFEFEELYAVGLELDVFEDLKKEELMLKASSKGILSCIKRNDGGSVKENQELLKVKLFGSISQLRKKESLQNLGKEISSKF